MYLRQIYVENNGPIELVNVDLPFTDDGKPKPLILVGGNGSGKTNFLSIVADALFEAAVKRFQDIIPGSTPVGHSWFRIVGGTTVRNGATGSVAILRFSEKEQGFFFKEKGGKVTAQELQLRLPDLLKPAAVWADEGSVKDFAIGDDVVDKIFQEGVYAYFPSSRSELPHWLNTEAVLKPEFDLASRFTNRLRKPLFVENSIDLFRQWLASLLLESRMTFNPLFQNGNLVIQPTGDFAAAVASISTLQVANQVVSRILNVENAFFAWLGRWNNNKIGVGAQRNLLVPDIRSLSAGQSTLLGIFGTILRYADHPRLRGELAPGQIEGICIVDEIDAHMHVDLQYRALPELVKMFPKIQFLVSSHSPLFVLGMEKLFGADGISILDMPSGTPIHAEGYAEFARALAVLQDTKAFASAVEQSVATAGKMLVYTEGETDPVYLKAAAELLECNDVLIKVEFQWIGAKDPKNGQGFHTGKDALNHTLSLLRAKPGLVKREIVLLYDGDANKADADYGSVHVRSVPQNTENDLVTAGIENLLPVAVFTDEMYTENVRKKPDGGQIATKTLNKAALCEAVCTEKRDASNFLKFKPVLETIAALAPSAEKENAE